MNLHFVKPFHFAKYFVVLLIVLRGSLHGNDAVCAPLDLVRLRATKRILGVQATRVVAFERLHGLAAWQIYM